MLSACVSNPASITKKMITVEGLGSLPYLAKQYPNAQHLNWKYKGPIRADICLGHSFGAGRLMRDDVKCGIVITLDAREWKASQNSKYVSTHSKHYNFYQTSGLRGYPIKNAVNKKVTGTSHTDLPRAAKDMVKEILK